MIRTRPHEDGEPIAGSGEHVLAITEEELQLVAALVGLVRLGDGIPYREAAFKILMTIEELTGNMDYSSDALAAIQPEFVVIDLDSGVVLQHFGPDDVVEIVV